MTHARWLVVVAVALALGIAGGRWLAPERVVTRDRIVEKTSEARRDEVRATAAVSVAHVRGVRTVVKYIERPDGTKEREERTEDVTTDKARTEAATERVRTETKTLERVEYRERLVDRARPQWALGARVRSDLLAGGGVAIPGVFVDRRLAGPVWLTAGVEADRRFGVGVRVEW